MNPVPIAIGAVANTRHVALVFALRQKAKIARISIEIVHRNKPFEKGLARILLAPWGQNVGEKMLVSVLNMREPVYVNHDRLHQLNRQLGEDTSRDILLRAIEEVAMRLKHIAARHDEGAFDEMRRAARSLIGIADQIGLDTLTMVADDVVDSVETGDPVATAATAARLLRIGETSLHEICAFQGMAR